MAMTAMSTCEQRHRVVTMVFGLEMKLIPLIRARTSNRFSSVLECCEMMQ